MRLVPRQLLRSGMTGSVPYYGGRFTPEQAYAISHPGRPAPRPAPPNTIDAMQALRHLLDTGVITQEEFDQMQTRLTA